MDPPAETAAELESFRQRWREEVTARARQGHNTTRDQNAANTLPDSTQGKAPAPKPAPRRVDQHQGAEEIEPKAYHDLPDKEAEMMLGAAEQGLVRGSSSKEPRSALEHYEKAVEKETQGCLGDSLKLYQRAFKVRHQCCSRIIVSS